MAISANPGVVIMAALPRLVLTACTLCLIRFPSNLAGQAFSTSRYRAQDARSA